LNSISITACSIWANGTCRSWPPTSI
jgi:hypothetical protein